jgi:hypothetical protein
VFGLISNDITFQTIHDDHGRVLSQLWSMSTAFSPVIKAWLPMRTVGKAEEPERTALLGDIIFLY